MWFTRLMVPFKEALRNKMGYRVLTHLDDFLLVSRRWDTVSTGADFNKARERKCALLHELGLSIHSCKEEWVGATRVEHLQMIMDTMAGRFYIFPRKIARIRSMAKKIIHQKKLRPSIAYCFNSAVLC